MTVWYTEKVDEVIYKSGLCDSFSEDDYIDLALASLDQSGMSKQDQDRVASIIGRGGVNDA